MSSINLCDREGCKSMVRGRALGVVALVTNSTPEPERVEREICPGCVADVLSLLETAPTTDREAAYSEPFLRAAEESSEGRLVEALAEAVEAALDSRDKRRQRELGSGDQH